MATSDTTRPLRVVHIIGGLELGGAETLLYRLVTEPMHGVEHELICLGKRDWYSDKLETAGIAVTHLDMNSPMAALRAMRTLRRALRASRADVIQSWMYIANLLAPIAARGSGIPIVWGIHNSSFEHVGRISRLSARVAGAAARFLTKFVINCSRRSSEIHARLGYSAVPNAVIHNGYDATVFQPDAKARVAMRTALGLHPGVFVIGSIARWHPQKDIPTLLSATKRAVAEVREIRCLLIGRGLGPENDELQWEIESSGCDGLVLTLGERADVPDLARAIDLHVLTSSGGEAFPNVVAETMLSGTPNVVTDVGDSAFMVGDTGWVVRAGDSAGIGEAIVSAYREWSADKASWKRRRKEARLRIADRFSFAKMARAYEDVWRRVAQR